MRFASGRWARGRRSSRPPGVYLWTARGLFSVATALLVWAGASLVSDDPVEQASAPQSYGPVLGQSESRRFAAEVADRPAPPIQAPIERARQPLRSGGAAVQAPADSVAPTSIEIPALGIDQDLTELAVIGNDLQVPDDYSDIGWWRGGPAPGEEGASVMVGHLDTPTGPAVFYQLSALQAGDRITVGLDDRSRRVFAVRETEVYERTSFPSARVYRPDGLPTLHLLTCGGSFDTVADQYSSNVVVYAELVKRIAPPHQKREGKPKLTPARQQRPKAGPDGPKARSERVDRPNRPEGRSGDPEWYDRLVQDSRERISAAEAATRFDREKGLRQ